MKKILLFSLIGFVVTGCAQKIDSNLSSFEGVTYTNYMDEYKYINTYTINGTTNKKMEDVNVCVLQNIKDKDVVLSDTSNNFIGATGRYYSLPSSQLSSNKGSTKYVGSDVIVINGLTQYKNPQSFIPVTNYVRYTLSIKKTNDNIQYFFNNITQAQAETGSIPNNGFNPVGNWDGANPSVILNTLKDEMKKIEMCLNR